MATVTQAQRTSAIAVTSYRIIGLMGIIGVLTLLVSVFGIQGDAPGIGDPTSEARTWWADNGQQYAIGDYVGSIALVLFIPFFVGLYSIFSRSEGADALGSRVALTAFIAYLLFLGASGISSGALALGANQFDDGTIRALQFMEFYTFSGVVPMAIALLTGSASYVILKTKVLWTWLAWLGVALAVAGLVGAAAPIDGDPEGPLAGVGLIAIAGLQLWTLAAAINLLVSKTLDNSQ
jgi:hypothetical protein